MPVLGPLLSMFARKQKWLRFIKHSIIQLLASPNPPVALVHRSLFGYIVDADKPLENGSDDTLFLHYLLKILTSSQDQNLLDLAAEKSEALLRKSNPSGVPYAFPQVRAALEQRYAVEYARQAHSGNLETVLRNLDNFGLRDPGKFMTPPIVRNLPAMGKGVLATRLQTAIKKIR